MARLSPRARTTRVFSSTVARCVDLWRRNEVRQPLQNQPGKAIRCGALARKIAHRKKSPRASAKRDNATIFQNMKTERPLAHFLRFESSLSSDTRCTVWDLTESSLRDISNWHSTPATTPGSRLSGLVRGCSLQHRRNRPIGAGGPTDGSNRGRALTHRPGVLQRFVLIPKKKPRW